MNALEKIQADLDECSTELEGYATYIKDEMRSPLIAAAIADIAERLTYATTGRDDAS